MNKTYKIRLNSFFYGDEIFENHPVDNKQYWIVFHEKINSPKYGDDFWVTLFSSKLSVQHNRAENNDKNIIEISLYDANTNTYIRTGLCTGKITFDENGGYIISTKETLEGILSIKIKKEAMERFL